jgi:hypothetical protein
MASCVRCNILEPATKAKYFSINFDCTPDLSHREQMSFALRFVDVCESDLIVQEHFTTFPETEEKTGQTLIVVSIKLLEDSKLYFKNCRGQGYDNSSSMRRESNGVQALIREENPRAFLCLVFATL